MEFKWSGAQIDARPTLALLRSANAAIAIPCVIRFCVCIYVGRASTETRCGRVAHLARTFRLYEVGAGKYGRPRLNLPVAVQCAPSSSISVAKTTCVRCSTAAAAAAFNAREMRAVRIKVTLVRVRFFSFAVDKFKHVR